MVRNPRPRPRHGSRLKAQMGINYTIKGIEIFGFVITTKKQLEKTPITLVVHTASETSEKVRE